MYTNKTTIENYLMTDIDSSFDTQIATWITAAENYINNYCNKPGGFEVGLASDKYYDGNGKSEIDVNDFISIDSVQILESNGSDVQYNLTEGENSDYITYPYNTEPKFRLKLTSNSQVGSWLGGDKRIKITAIWGNSSSVPEDIQLIATMLVAGVVEKGIRGGKVRSESLGDYSISYQNIEDSEQTLNVKKTLNQYKVFKI